jgi:hypothetical protein
VPDREIRLAQPLLNEVVNWASDSLFVRSDIPDTPPAYLFSGGEIPIRIVSIAEWKAAIDIHNEDSVYVTLIELINEIEGAYRLIHQFGQFEFQDYVTNQHEQIRVLVTENNKVEEVAKALQRTNVHPLLTLDETLDQLWSTIHTHLTGVIYARAVSLSTRHAPTEALFQAYRLGLLPFGWDWESIICLDVGNLARQ